jgi:hypothetical protein
MVAHLADKTSASTTSAAKILWPERMTALERVAQ